MCREGIGLGNVAFGAHNLSAGMYFAEGDSGEFYELAVSCYLYLEKLTCHILPEEQFSLIFSKCTMQ